MTVNSYSIHDTNKLTHFMSASSSSSRSRFFLQDQSQNSSNKTWPPPFLSIYLNSFSGSPILPTHFSMMFLAARNS